MLCNSGLSRVAGRLGKLIWTAHIYGRFRPLESPGARRKTWSVPIEIGGPPGNRTPNLRIKSPLLCLVELEAPLFFTIFFEDLLTLSYRRSIRSDLLRQLQLSGEVGWTMGLEPDFAGSAYSNRLPNYQSEPDRDYRQSIPVVVTLSITAKINTQ